MARIRTTKPELWTDPVFVEMSIPARLFVVAADCFASDYGVLLASAKQLKMQCYPGDSIDVEPLIAEALRVGWWQAATAPDGTDVWVNTRFRSYQRVEKPSPGQWGDPSTWEDTNSPDEPSPPPPGSAPEQSGNAPEASGWKGREGKGEEQSRGVDDHDTSSPDPDDVEHRTPPVLALVPPPSKQPPQGKLTEAAFEAFWRMYPRKVARKEALKVYTAAVRGKSAGVADGILEGLGPWLRYWREQGTEPQFIPHASRWLRGERWCEAPPAAPVKAAGRVDHSTGALLAPGVG